MLGLTPDSLAVKIKAAKSEKKAVSTSEACITFGHSLVPRKYVTTIPWKTYGTC